MVRLEQIPVPSFRLYPDTLTFLKQQGEEAKQVSLLYIERVAQEGDALARIENRNFDLAAWMSGYYLDVRV